MKKLLATYSLVMLTLLLSGQQQMMNGRISFISSQNVYVKFTSTENIRKGDTLYIKDKNSLLPVLTVRELSSISCLCQAISQKTLNVSDEIIAVVKKQVQISNNQAPEIKDSSAPGINTGIPETKQVSRPKDQLVRGRISVSSFSNFSNVPDDSNTRLRYTLSLTISKPGSPKLSAETYATYSHNTKELAQTSNNVFNSLKIYNLALKYQANNNLSLWAGRKINPRISSLGAIDGLQAEYKSGKYFAGIAAGSRPDYFDYSFNFKLIEYGAYFGHHYTSDNGIIQSTLGIFQQNNNGKTDRRFIYFQHDNSLAKNLNLFVSSEIDLYKVENGAQKNTISLTSLYLSLAYRVNRQLSLFGSYDERKNVIYYETFKSFLDQLIEKATRQGMQFRINYRPGKIINAGLSAGHQFRTGDIKSSDNVSGSVTFNQLPWANSYSTISANLIKTGYLNGKITGVKIYRDFFSGILNTGVGYQFVDYDLIQSKSTTIQHIANLDLYFRIDKKLSLSVNLEKTFEKQIDYTRVYANLIKRF